MTSAATHGLANQDLISALSAWRGSVERLLLVVDRAIEHGPESLAQSDQDEFAAALRALYALESEVFEPAHVDLPKAA